MKRFILAIALLAAAAAVAEAAAQPPFIALEGVSEGPGGLKVSDPRTILAVDVTVCCEEVQSGPYARYAQKYLGVRAPLTDKKEWTIRSAAVGLVGGTSFLELPAASPDARCTLPHAASDEGFARLQPDRTAPGMPTLEDAARDAAAAIYALRRHRMELITGEAGENVFGGGLSAALDEIARLEQEYLELFLGRQTRSTLTRRYIIYPRADKQQYIVARFHATSGLLPESDLSGDMILLQIDPSGLAATLPEASPKQRSTVRCRVAATATCTIVSGGREYARAELPIFEFGRTLRLALPQNE